MLANNSYTRPSPAAVLPDTRWPPRCAGGAEQVHLALGGPGEMVVSFATALQGASAVEWWREGGGGGGRAVGTPAAYSQLIYVDEWLSHPPMGAPRVPEDHLLALQDTSAWAYDRATGRRFANYMKPKALAYGLGAYNNPQMYYDSPAIHRVSLRNLRPGARYGYRVAGDARNFSFTMPPDGDGAAFPLTFGLTADIGQTVVSKLNAEWLLSQLSDAEPYAARNSSDRAQFSQFSDGTTTTPLAGTLASSSSPATFPTPTATTRGGTRMVG